MSHFTVLVIGDTNGCDYEKALAPYQENNMGDCPKEYMEFKPLSEIDTNREIKYYDEHDTVKEIKDFDKYMSDCGYEKVNEQWGHYENPNAKWDWYKLGGRWTGFFKLKDGAKDFVTNIPESMSEESKSIYAELARVKDIDFTPDKNEIEKYKRYWEVVVEKSPLKETENEDDFFNYYKDGYYTERFKDKETYIKVSTGTSTYAVIKDGKWYAPGDMGWWGCSSEELNEALDWDLNYYDRFFKDLDPDTFVAVVDCHI